MSLDAQALTFSPLLEERVWGGRKLEEYGKALPPGKPIGESWEVSDVEGKPSLLSRGAYSGLSLTDLLRVHREPLLGPGWAGSIGPFPLLLKLLDARENLSVQLHPSDADLDPASGLGGKTEAWIILQAEPQARILHGLDPRVERGAFHARMKELGGKALSCREEEALFRWVEVEPGDVIFVPAGTIHAIGGGIVLLEVQQTSDITYRIYDWGRPGTDGKPRALHVSQAMSVSAPRPVPCPWGNVKRTPARAGFVSLLSCDKFEIELLKLGEGAPASEVASTTAEGRRGPRFQILSAFEGDALYTTARGDRLEIGPGRFVLLPAALGEYTLAAEGPASVLRFTAGA